MSGGGGGIIIISNIRPAADLDTVKGCLTPAQRIVHNNILAKPDHEWTAHDLSVILRHIAAAFDDC